MLRLLFHERFLCLESFSMNITSPKCSRSFIETQQGDISITIKPMAVLCLANSDASWSVGRERSSQLGGEWILE